MSVEIMTRVWKHSEATGVELLLLVALADYAGDDGYCYPRQDTLAQKIRTTDRNVRRYLKRLEERGEVFILSGKGRSSDTQRWEHNRYVVAIGMGVDELARVFAHHFEMSDTEAMRQAEKVIGRIRPDTQESNRTKRVRVSGRIASKYQDESRQSIRTNSSYKPTPQPPTEPSEEPPTAYASGGASSTPSVSGSVGAPAAQNDDKHGAVGEGDAAAEDDAATGRYGLDGLSGECRRAAVRFMAIVGRNYLTEGEYHVFWSEGQLGAKAVKPHDHDWLLDTIERDLAAGKLDKYGDDLGPVLKWRYNDKHKRDGEKRADGKKPKAPAVRRRSGETDSAERRKEYQLP